MTIKSITFVLYDFLEICFIGCYADATNSRVLNGFGTTTVNVIGGGSVETCINYCKNKGFKYAGVQFA